MCSFLQSSRSIITFTGEKRKSNIASMDCRTLLCPLRLVKNSNLEVTNVSKLIFSSFNPAACNLTSFLDKTMPFEVTARFLRPGRLLGCSHNCSMSGLKLGSPPVSLILFTPSDTKILASCIILPCDKSSRNFGSIQHLPQACNTGNKECNAL